VAMLASAAFMWRGTLSQDANGVAGWFSLSMGALGIAEGPFWVAATNAGGQRGGWSAAFFNTGGNAGGMLAPVVTPIVCDRFGWPAGFALNSIVCLFGAVLWLGVKTDWSDE
jgi:dipeptide/tripeptide permease